MRYARFSVTLVAAMLVATGCRTDLTSLNNNPNSPTSAPPAPLFTRAVTNAVGRWVGGGQLSGSELFAQHIAQVQYVEEDRGRLRTETIDSWFTNAYVSELEDFEKVAQFGDAQASPNTAGPARVMQAWVYENMTDFWGDIPYSEALKGDAGGPLKPKYDTQKDIYYGLLQTLADASSSMQPASADGALGSGDPIYGGDIGEWLKLSNSLRARMALRISKADPAKAAAELTAAFSAPGGVMGSNADNAEILWPGDGVFDNPWAARFATRDDHRVSKTLLDTMTALADPRVSIFAQPTVDDPTKYVGLQNGLDNPTAATFFNSTSRPGAIFYPGNTSYGNYGTAAGKATPTYIMTYAEMEFIRAEAAERGLGGQSGAAGHYNAGVRASILQWGGTNAEADAYLATPGVAYVPGAEGLRQIGLQKWISLFTQGNEAWAEWRRTGNPNTVIMGPMHYADVPEIPRRVLYPSNEQTVNAEALAAAITRQGADTYITRLWWDTP